MRRRSSLLQIAAAGAASVAGFSLVGLFSGAAPIPRALAAEPSCDLSAYKAVSGLAAANASDGLRLLWDGEKNQELRLRLCQLG